jgi:hypothetical protein
MLAIIYLTAVFIRSGGQHALGGAGKTDATRFGQALRSRVDVHAVAI